MRTILVLTCCLALTAVVRAEDQTDKNKTNAAKTNTAKTTATVHTHTHTGANFQSNKFNSNTNVSNTSKWNKGTTGTQLNSNTNVSNAGKWHKGNNWSKTNQGTTNTQLNTNVSNAGKWNKGNNWSKNKTGNHTFHTQQFHLNSGPKTGIASVKFKQNNFIKGSQNWKGQKYSAFKNYKSQWHDQNWWHSHHNKIILISGGYYYWDNGYYYPAWGYDSANEYYPYDGPIYSYNDMPPDQVTANVQTALQQEGYYQGEIDGLIGPQTRAALAQYQQDHGLEPTSAMDEPTVDSLLGQS